MFLTMVIFQHLLESCIGREINSIERYIPQESSRQASVQSPKCHDMLSFRSGGTRGCRVPEAQFPNDSESTFLRSICCLYLHANFYNLIGIGRQHLELELFNSREEEHDYFVPGIIPCQHRQQLPPSHSVLGLLYNRLRQRHSTLWRRERRCRAHTWLISLHLPDCPFQVVVHSNLDGFFGYDAHHLRGHAFV